MATKTTPEVDTKPAPEIPRIAYSIEELAQAAPVSRGTIYNEIKAGWLVPSYVGDRPLITVDEARRWLASKRRKAV